MGSVGIITVVISMSIFGLGLYWGSLLYSFFFSKSGRNTLFREFYECGFRSVPDNKIVLDLHFATIGLIFLIYEIEIILFVPILLNLYGLSLSIVGVVLFSIILLGSSYWYEWERYGLTFTF